MNIGVKDSQIAGERGELYVFGELLKRGVVSYLPLVDQGLDALVRCSDGEVIEIQIKSAGGAGGKHPGWFQMPKFGPRRNLFIVCVEFSEGEPQEAWIFPSIVYDEYANRSAKGGPRDLDLDGGVRKHGLKLRDLLCGLRNRWELIVDFPRYAPLIERPEDLEDILTMAEALDSKPDEALGLQDYERNRSGALRG